MTGYRIPFNRVSLFGREATYVEEALTRGHLAGDGPFSRGCQALLEETLGVEKVLLTTSGTHALEMAAMLLDVAPGDEVIAPSFTFPSTVNAFVTRGATPVLIDVRPDTLNIDEARIERHITDRTRAIVVVHYGGVGCEMDVIDELAARRGIPVIEDNAMDCLDAIVSDIWGRSGVLPPSASTKRRTTRVGKGVR